MNGTMEHRSRLAIAAALFLALVPAATAATAGQQPAESAITMNLATETIAPGSTAIVGGVPVDPQDWPALVVARLASGIHCTATLIGPRVVLTAAHCLDRGRDAGGANLPPHGVQFRKKGRSSAIAATCTLSEKYLAASHSPGAIRHQADYALCRLDDDVIGTANTGGQPDTLDITSSPAKNSVVFIAGYGCTSYGGPQSEVLMAGEAAVVQTPAGDGAAGESIAAAMLIMEGRAGAAGICPGDSGGPTYAGARLASQTAAGRRLIGVNSAYHHAFRTSYVATTAATDFRAFVTTWSQANGNPVICGVNRQAGTYPCRR